MSKVREIFDEFELFNSQNEISIEKMKEDLGDKLSKICLYGAGSAGIAFLYYLRDAGIEPRYFVDKNQIRWGTVCEGLEVIAPEQIIELLGEDALVIVTINTDGKRYCKSFEEALRKGGHAGVHKMLRECGVKNDIDYTYFRRCHKLFHGDPYNLPSCSDVYCMLEHIEDLEEVYSYLADDLSREVFLKILRFRLIDDSLTIPTMQQDRQYFEYELCPRREDEIFIDCGAFNGISAKTFFEENNNQFEKYYGFEPDSKNYMALAQFMSEQPEKIRNRMKIYEKAVYDHNAGVMLYELNGPGSFVADIGRQRVETIKIDDALQGEKATYIKMNIEGSELQALRGAEGTIETYKPRLAVAGYHKTWDLWEVPKLIRKYNGSYKIYLRSYMNHISFVYYCE